MHEGQAIGTFIVIRAEIDPGSSKPQRVSVIASSPMRLLTFRSFGIDRLCAAIPAARERILASLPESHVYASRS
ncbi:MAG TPA: hypothetical protein VG294_08945 [Solirubrobacteraceae bacterium]|jgi:hypothetical protein|nr:hypothetical protein [Solirubrobacteraceae bacterium]